MANPLNVQHPPGSGSWSGCSGFSGYSGFSGSSGTSGEAGPSGISGLALAGPSGKSGYSGVSGFSGTSGVSGFSGFSGLVGDVGASGFSGSAPSGTSGDSGVSGYTGESGYSGASGFSGRTSGFSGTSGVSGYEFGSAATPIVLSSGATAAVDANTKTFAFSAFAGDAAFGLVNRKVLVNFWMSTTDLGDVDVTPSPLVANVGTLLYPPSAALGSERTGWVLTDDTGAFEIEATILGAPGAQYFMASVFNDVKSISNTFT